MSGKSACLKCGLIEASTWWKQPMNETLREYAEGYISPVKMFYKDLDEAMKVWGTEITDEA